MKNFIKFKNLVEKKNIILIGPIGAGKSTIGRQLAKKINMNFFDSDNEIEKCTGVNLCWIFDVEGEESFRKREKKIIDLLTQKNKIVLSTGGGSVKSKETRRKLYINGIVIYLKTNVEQQLLRTKYDKKYPLLKVKIPIRNILEMLAIERNSLYEEIADITICTSNKNIKMTVNKIINLTKKNF